MPLLDKRSDRYLWMGSLLVVIMTQGCVSYPQKAQQGQPGVDSACHHSVNVQLPIEWAVLDPIICARLTQPIQKMKLTKHQVNHFIGFLWTIPPSTPSLLALTDLLPKTTLALLRGVEMRGVPLDEAEKMAAYLSKVPEIYSVHNIAAFDENTSHIMGRQWHEIDYSGEGMTWQQQQQKYAPYDITDFKSLVNLEKFFPVESQLPYFKEAYQ